MGAKACIVVGIVCLLIGLGCIFGGTFGVKYEVPKQKIDYLVVDSTKSPQYKDWAGGYDEQVPYQMVFYFFNLSNPDDVRQKGAVPNYSQLGPYVYRRYRKSLNVSFPNGGSQVEFVDFRDYQFDAENSVGSQYDYAINLNPVFLSALGQAGNEQQMLGGAAGGYFSNYSQYFTGDFVSLYTSFVLPEKMQNAVNMQISIINETLKDTTASYQYFLSAWVNGTNTTIGNWTGLLLPNSNNGKPTDISHSSAAMLLDPTIPYSLLNTAEKLTPWAWDRCMVNSNYSNLLMEKFGLTFPQLEAIWNWRLNSFGPTFIYESAKQQYNLSDISDIGWAQWTAGYGILGGSISAPVSIHDLFPTEEIGYYATVELFAYPASPNVLNDWRTVKQILNPVTGLGNMSIFQEFAFTAANQNLPQNYSQWGMTTDEAEQLYIYLLFAGTFQVVPALKAEFGPSGGLVLNQTIDDWVFNCNYFLINLLLPVPTPCSFLVNHTVFNTGKIHSGKHNISAINEYIEWNGSPTVSGVWANDVPVRGHTELGQFQPDQDSSTVLETFNDEFVRTMSLKYNSSGVVREINTNRFILDYNNTFSVNQLYFQSIPGFANLTLFKQAPIYYSLWDMLYVDESIRKSVTGLNDSIAELDASTIIDVEPITGNTLQVRKRLQANMYVPPNCGWCSTSTSFFENFNITSNTFFPFVKAGEYSEITESLASKVRSKLGALKNAPKYGMIVGLSVGGFLVLLGVVLIAFGRRRMTHNYEGINDYVRK